MTDKPTAKIEMTCAYCGKTFTGYKRDREHFYCCQEHYHTHRKALRSVEMTCAHCGKPITVKHNRITTHNYCSIECHARHRKILHVKKPKVEHTIICEQCGKPFVPTNPSKKIPQRFCSKTCAMISRHKTWTFTPNPKKRTITYCAYCHKEIAVISSVIRKRNYCCSEHYHIHFRELFASGAETPFRRLTDEYILSVIKDLAQQLGRPPTREELDAMGKFNASACSYHFGTWLNALELAGFASIRRGKHNSPIVISYCKYSGVKVRFQSTYEYRFAKVLDALGVTWLCHAEMKPVRYTTPDGKTHRYYPDFYVNDWDTFVETKGWYNESQQAKVAAIRASHPTMTLIIVTKPLLEMYERCIKQPLLPFQ